MDDGRWTTDDDGGGAVSVDVLGGGPGGEAAALGGVFARVAKASAQMADAGAAGAAQVGRGGRLWAEPRYGASDLLHFFDTSTWHRRCCILKATLGAGLGWTLEPDPASARRPTAKGRAAAMRLFGRVNESGEDLAGVCVKALVDLEAIGYAGIEVVRRGDGAVAELYHVPARTLRRARGGPGFFQVAPGAVAFGGAARGGGAAGTVGVRAASVPFAAYRGAETRPFRGARSALVWLSEYDPRDDAYGAPAWLGALGALALDRSAVEHNVALFRNGLMAHAAVTVSGGKLSAEAIDGVRRFFQSTAVGVENAGRVLLLQTDRDGAKVEVSRLDVAAQDLGFVEGRRALRDEIVSAHGVPPRLVGIAAAGQLGGAGEVEGQLRTFREAVIRPRQRMLSAALQSVADSVSGGGWRVAWSVLDVTDAAADAALARAGVGLSASP